MDVLYSSYEKYEENTIENNGKDVGDKAYVFDTDVGVKDFRVVESDKDKDDKK
jgi:hypothetical protein